MRGCVVLVLVLGLAGCRQLLGIDEPIIAKDDAAPMDVRPDMPIDSPLDAMTDAPIDAGPTILSLRVNCATGAQTANQLCQAMGYPNGAGAVRGHGWWQCAGPEDRCLGGFVGLSCPDWCATTDCVQLPFCNAGHAVYQVDGTGATIWDPVGMSGADCTTGNPGWTIRATCLP